MEIYSEEELKRQKLIRKRARMAMAAVSAAAVIVCVVMFCTVTPFNEGSCRTWAVAALSVAACFDVYVGSFVLPYLKPQPSGKSRSKAGRVAGNLLRQLLLYILCVLFAAIFTTFVFGRIRDTVPEKKISIFADVPAVKSAELEVLFSEDLPEGIKMVKVRTFDYDYFGFAGGNEADIYIVEEANAEKYLEHFAPVSEFLPPRSIYQYYIHDGEPYGVLVKGGGNACAAQYVDYQEGRDYYLFFGKQSRHPGQDGAAAYIAERLMMLR